MNSKKWMTRLIVATISFGVLFAGSAVGQAPKASAASATVAKRIINLGDNYLGRPYKFGAKVGQTRTFDCSSFTKYVYGKNGIYLPRTSKAQSKAGRYVPRSQLKPGDLVFFYKPIHHVAIYIGNGKILHTYGKPGVTISSIKSGWWSKHYTTARRVG